MTTAPSPNILDTQNMAASIRAFPDQCAQALEETAAIAVPESYREANAICVAGMGGSALGAHVTKALYHQLHRVPLIICRDYKLPGWVDSRTLVVLSSYSGGTAEAISCAQQASDRNAMLLGLTAGGALGEFMEAIFAPWYRIEPTHNPCGQPRMALGYAIVGLLALLWKTNLLPNDRQALGSAIEELRSLETGVEAAVIARLHGKFINVVASEHLEGNAHILANQLNENAKCQATWHQLPELNHHLMEGLVNPPTMRSLTAFVFLESEHYSSPIKARYEVMKGILDELDITWVSIPVAGKGLLAQALSAVMTGSWISYDLAMRYEIDPSPIPYVDKFKQELTARGF